MPSVRRERVLQAPPSAVWGVVSDAHHQPRWWPRVVRVERVGGGRFTQVLTTDRGRQVRADFRVIDRQEGRAIAWTQELEGTPFATVFRSSTTHVEVAPAAGGTLVAITVDQRLAGMSRIGGGLMIRRGTGRILDEALAGLAEVAER